VYGTGIRAGDNLLEGTKAIRALEHVASEEAEGPQLVLLGKGKRKGDLTAVFS